MSLFDLIKEVEGAEKEVYRDSKNIPSIGVGFNLREKNVLAAVLEYLGFEQLDSRQITRTNN